MMNQVLKILITGVSGLAGGHIARFFAGQNAELYGLARQNSNTGFISDLPLRIIHGDITDAGALAGHFRGMDAIVHTAAKVADWGSYDDFHRVNVQGTLNVLKAAAANRVSRVIILGSVSSYGEENCGYLKDESHPFRSHYPYAFDNLLPSGMNHYRDTKAEATRLAMEFAGANGMNLTILEPAWIYGEFESKSGFYEYLKQAASGIPFMPGCRSNTFHVIYAGELARACWLALQAKTDGVVRMIIGNREPEKMQHIFALFCREAGVKQPRRIPKWIVYPVALNIESVSLVLKKSSPPLLTRSRVNMFYDSIGYSTARAEQLIGFTNRVDLETGIRDTVAWYKKNNWL